MKNAEYWASRFLDLKKETENQTFEYMETVEREFRKASRKIQADILVWYQRFAENNQITLTEAKKLLNSRELEELRWTVEDYIKAGKENEISGQWVKQLENASARVHISRLEALQIQLQQQAEILFGNQTDELDKFLQSIYTDRYYRSAFEIQKGTGIGWTFQKFDERQLKTLLSKPWAADGQNFSDRIWKNKQLLLNELQTNMIQGIIRGENPQKAAQRLAKRLDVSEQRASLLVYTESSYFSERAQRDVYKELDVEEYELLETLDSHTCEICGPLDGKVFPMSQYQPGITAPPFHPRCRGTTVPHIDDDYGERAARNHEGKTIYVPADMTYQEWYQTYIEKSPKSGIIKPSKAKQTLTDDEEWALNEYISSGSYKINAPLREGIELTQEQQELVRNLDSALEKMPKYQGKTIRSLVMNKESLIQFAKGHKIGSKVRYPEYISASTRNGYHDNPTVVLNILSKSGRDIREYNEQESEILFKRNSCFCVLNVKLQDGIFVLEMEEVL